MIAGPWPPNQANALEPGAWRLELLVRGDNIKPERSFVTVSFDEILPEKGSAGIWEHFTVLARSPRSRGRPQACRSAAV